jgi:hypothetical protein
MDAPHQSVLHAWWWAAAVLWSDSKPILTISWDENVPCRLNHDAAEYLAATTPFSSEDIAVV